MAAPKIDPEKVSRILIDAAALGDAEAAKRHCVSVRSIERYRARMPHDNVLAAAVGRKAKEADASWHVARAKTLRALMARIEIVAEGEDDLDKLSQAAARVGEIDVATTALTGGSNVGDSPDSEGPAPTEDPGGGREGEPEGAAISH